MRDKQKFLRLCSFGQAQDKVLRGESGLSDFSEPVLVVAGYCVVIFRMVISIALMLDMKGEV